MPTLAEVQINASLYSKKRRSVSRNDFGDEATVGLALRKMDWQSLSNKNDNAKVWGIFYGEYKGMWYVGTMKTLEFEPSELAEYYTIDDLKREWELD